MSTFFADMSRRHDRVTSTFSRRTHDTRAHTSNVNRWLVRSYAFSFFPIFLRTARRPSPSPAPSPPAPLSAPASPPPPTFPLALPTPPAFKDYYFSAAEEPGNPIYVDYHLEQSFNAYALNDGGERDDEEESSRRLREESPEIRPDEPFRSDREAPQDHDVDVQPDPPPEVAPPQPRGDVEPRTYETSSDSNRAFDVFIGAKPRRRRSPPPRRREHKPPKATGVVEKANALKLSDADRKDLSTALEVFGSSIVGRLTGKAPAAKAEAGAEAQAAMKAFQPPAEGDEEEIRPGKMMRASVQVIVKLIRDKVRGGERTLFLSVSAFLPSRRALLPPFRAHSYLRSELI